VSAGKEVAFINATLEVDSMDQLFRVFARLERIKGMLHVERDLGKSNKK
jgi:guanosine-3',5'-bis(diphosphate) 3'-pyrophosphohydrolase